MAHPVWTSQEVNSVVRTHKKPANLTDYTALAAVGLCKFVFDSLTFFKWGTLTEKKVLNRAIFLETVAAVPGMVIISILLSELVPTDLISKIFADWRYAAPLKISPENGSRPRLDPHSSGRGGERTHAPVDILETKTARPNLQTFRDSYSGKAKVDAHILEFCGISVDALGRAWL